MYETDDLKKMREAAAERERGRKGVCCYCQHKYK